jgi:hypothetical protein
MLSKDVRPQNPTQYLRGSSRRCPGAGQDGGVQAIIPRQETCRDAVCAFETYTSPRPVAIARAMRCPVRVHAGGDCAEPPQAGQVGRPAATIRLFVRCVSVASVSKVERKSPAPIQRVTMDGFKKSTSRPAPSVCRFLQQNLPRTDMVSRTCQVRNVPMSGSQSIYSITSSAVKSNSGGISTPSALAVLRLIAISNFVGCSTGRSAGFSPLRIRPA